MKTVCVYHSIDLDGWMSAAIVKHWWINMPEMKSSEDVLDFIGFNYGMPIPDLSSYDKVIMCDISFPTPEMHSIMQRIGDYFIWCDHHISAIDDVFTYYETFGKGLPFPAGIRKTEFAACELTWQYFFPETPMPEIVRLLGRYDCFGHKGTSEEQKVLEFQYGARGVISNYEEAYEKLASYFALDKNQWNIINPILADGAAIYKFLCEDARQSYKNGFEIYFPRDDARAMMNVFICINKERFNPINFGIKYHDDGYDGCACFHFNGIDWSFSLYNDDGKVDVSQICKQYGGGGHAGAAGFRIKDITQIIK